MSSESKIDGMTVFVGELHLRATNKWNGRRRVYRLSQEFVITTRYPGVSEIIHVPFGFETDLATLPVIVQVVLGNRDNYAEEAVIHDWLCTNNVPRWIANAKMRSVMLVLRRARWRRMAIFWGLMLFGYRSPISKGIRKLWESMIGRRKKQGTCPRRGDKRG